MADCWRATEPPMLQVVALSAALQSTPAQLHRAMSNTKAHINFISNPLTIKMLNVMHHHHVSRPFSPFFPPHSTFPGFVFNTSMDDSVLADAVRRPSIRRYFCNPVLNTSPPQCVCVCAHTEQEMEGAVTCRWEEWEEEDVCQLWHSTLPQWKRRGIH